MKRSSIGIVFASLFAANLVCAADEGDKPAYTLSSNVYLTTDYLFRGQTQTWGRPAVQGGFDFVHESGLYAGTWASNVSGNQFAGGSMELDLYAGYGGKITDDIGYTGGLLYYYYPGANFNKATGCTPGSCVDKRFNTLELSLGGSWAWLSTKLSYSLTDYFGASDTTASLAGDTKGTLYLEANANYPIVEGLTLVAHLGFTRFPEKRTVALNGETDPSYLDWKLGVSYAGKEGWTAGAYYVDATNDDYYRGATSFANSDTRDLNKSAFYVTVGRTF